MQLLTVTLSLVGCGGSSSDSVVPRVSVEATRRADPWTQEVKARVIDGSRAFAPIGDGFEAGVAGFDGHFGVDGARLTTGDDTLTVQLVGFGRDRAISKIVAAPSLGACIPGAIDPAGACVQRLEYAGAGLTEWWAGQASGFEQGWTVAAPPRGFGQLTVDVAIGGATVALDRGDLTLQGANGGLVVVSGLAAIDATGKSLVASFLPTDAGFRVTVDDRGAVYPVDIDPVYTTATSTLDGEAEGDEFGISVSTAGDVNGDGFDDVIVGAPGNGGIGRAYVYHGSVAGLVLPAAATLSGESAGQLFGAVVTGGGDFNNDGFSDVAVGAPGQGGLSCEFVIEPVDTGDTDVDTDTDVGDTDDTDDTDVGDTDTGDTDPPVDHGFPGSVFVYLGTATGVSPTPIVLVGETGCDHFGFSVAVVGDIHDDKRSDLAVGAWGYNEERGRAYLFSGSSSGISSSATVVDGAYYYHHLGYAVGRPNDTDRDGFDDLAIGAPGISTVYVFGGGSFGLSDARLHYVTSADPLFGISLSGADVNGDRFSDLLVGAPGVASVFHGSFGGPSASADEVYYGPSTMNPVGVGDLDDDGYDEIAVGTADPALGVEVYEGSIDGSTETTIATFTGGVDDAFGVSVSGAGDVNGDGADDLLIGAPGYDANTGRAYYYKGFDDTDADGDLYNATDDCDDANAAIHPGAIEICDALNADEDCNGLADDSAATGQSTFYADTDADKFGDADSPILACDAPAGYVVDNTDCDDTIYKVHPGATEVCNELDDNCDGSTDGDDAAEPLVWYEDADGDSFPNPDVQTADCQQPEGFVKLGEDDDCDDNNAQRYPFATEIPGDGIDQDCDGEDPGAEKKCGCANSAVSPGWMLGLVALFGLRRRSR